MSTDLFDKFDPLIASYGGLVGQGPNPFAVQIEHVISPTEAMIKGRRTILAGTFNYLGMTFEPLCIDAAIEALRREGTGTTGSRIANGNYSVHAEMEQALAQFLDRRSVMVFTTCHQANLGILSAIVGPKDFVLMDADCHASIYDGLKMGSATVVRFRHNDPEDLDKRLQRLSGEPGAKLIVVEGIYSILGDQAPLEAFVAVKRKHGAYLLIDEAHSLGVLGKRARGLAEAVGCERDVDFVIGTFSKSLGAIGGFCASDHPKFDALRLACRTYMYTASLPPAIIASARTALRLVQERPELRARLWRNAERFHAILTGHGFTLAAPPSPVISTRLPDPHIAYAFWNELLESGVFVTLAVPPATPNSWSLLRSAVCAVHTDEQIDRLGETYLAVARRMGLSLSGARLAAQA